MPTRPNTREELEQAVAAIARCSTKTEAARSLGIPRGTLASRLECARQAGMEVPEPEPLPSKEAVRSVQKKNDWTIEWTDLSIESEEMLESLGVDMSVWCIVQNTYSGWDMTGRAETIQVGKGHTKHKFKKFLNCQRKVVLKRIIPDATDSALKLIAKRLGSGPALKLAAPKRKARKSNDRILFEVSILDHHFGKFGWHREVGEDYDLDIARKLYDDTVDELALIAESRKVDRILYVLGHDLLHSEGASGETAHGTPQDCDGRWPKVHEVAFASVARGIERMHQIAPVDVVVLPGNHDKTTTFYLGFAIQQRYRSVKTITVDNEPTSRKKYRWGKNLIGLCHGGWKDDPKDRDLPMEMAQMWRDDWAQTQWQEWHLGDHHVSQKGYTQSDDTYNGVVVRRLPSLCGTDAWHFGKGYRGPKSSEAYLWSDKRGPLGMHTVTALALAG